MNFVKTMSFHCNQCGGIVMPDEDHCKFCGSKTSFRTNYNGKPKRIRVYLETKTGRKIHMHEAFYLYGNDYKEKVICENLYWNHGRTADCKIKVPFTKKFYEKAKFIEEQKIKKIYLDYGNTAVSADVCTGILCRPDACYPTDIPMVDYEFYLNGTPNACDSNTLFVNDGTICPNCGAKLRQRFGLCDYCGGWVNVNDFYE